MGSLPAVALLGFVSRENSNLRLASSDVNLTEVFSRYQRRHYGGDTDDDQGDNHRLMLLHCSLLLDLTVSKRHSTCVQHIGGLGLMVKYHSGLFSICRSANA